MSENKKNILQRLSFPILFVVFLWIVKLIELFDQINFAKYGVLPRTASGLIGILTAPLIHVDFNHLISNTVPLLVLGIGIYYSYPTIANRLFVIIYFVHGFLVWIFARQAYHIGASGLIYGFVSFLFFSGIIRRDNRSIALALIVTFLYGGLTWGVLPIKAEVSWEAHLFGSIVGIISAFIFRKYDPPFKYDWEDELDSSDTDYQNN